MKGGFLKSPNHFGKPSQQACFNKDWVQSKCGLPTFTDVTNLNNVICFVFVMAEINTHSAVFFVKYL